MQWLNVEPVSLVVLTLAMLPTDDLRLRVREEAALCSISNDESLACRVLCRIRVSMTAARHRQLNLQEVALSHLQQGVRLVVTPLLCYICTTCRCNQPSMQHSLSQFLSNSPTRSPEQPTGPSSGSCHCWQHQHTAASCEPSLAASTRGVGGHSRRKR